MFKAMKYIILILIVMTGYSAFSQKKYDSEWKSVDSLSNIGQPKSALDIVNKIYVETRADNNAQEFLKASIYQMALMSHFEEEVLEKIITSTEKDILTSSQPVKNVLHSLLAELYWKYYESNRYKFLDRTETKNFDDKDIRTWDLRRIVQACIDNYSLSLENKGMLQQIDLNGYEAILMKQSETRKLRPTLYDFLVHRAIDFYLNTETGLTQPAARFLIDNSRYFDPESAFIQMAIFTADTFSFQYQAIKLIQEADIFHSGDKDPAALIDIELKRLHFVYDNCILPEKDSLYIQSLLNLENRFPDHPSSTDVSYELARLLVSTGNLYQPQVSDLHKWDIKQAITIANAAILRFPESDGAYNCKCLIGQVQQLSFEITTDYANVPGKPALSLINYRNTSQVYFRLLTADPKDDRDMSDHGQQEAIKAYLAQKPLGSWVQSLPEDGDFQGHKAEIRLPSMNPGYYVLIASPGKNFSADSIITINRFWSTGISYISRRNDNGSYEVFVLDRQEGQPIQKVQVQQFFREYDYTLRKYKDEPGPVQITDNKGYVLIPSTKNNRNNQYYLIFSAQKDRFITESYFSNYSYTREEPRTVTSAYYFTDRAIYRPGQTIYFKGIVIDKKGDEVKIKPNHRSTVTLFDVNGQKVSSQDFTTNDFGSFSGIFTAPQGSLTGQMSIQGENGYVSIRVEEYKRPKFEVTFQPVEGSYKLNESVSVTGKAMAFAGSPISGSQVSYRVFRTARFPYCWWGGWREWLPQSPEMEIINGASATNDNGEFTITFKAIPDPTVQQKFNPVFDFRVVANITDLNGETHDANASVSVGSVALFISTNIPEEINLDSTLQFSISTTNLNGRKEASVGKISISKLTEPQRLLRKRNWSRPDRFTMDQGPFEKEFPNDIYDNEADISTWTKEKEYYSYSFNSAVDSLITPGIKIPVGSYVLEIETVDAYGNKVETKKYFTAYAPSSKEIPGKAIAWFTLPKTSAEPGEEITFLFGTAAKKIHAIYSVTKRITQEKLELVDIEGQDRFSIPVTEECRGNIGLTFCFVKYNRSFQVSKVISVPYSNKKLDISFASFRSKLEPGQEEEWHITIKDQKGEKAVAEMLAGMYDASLDAFVPHAWALNLFNYNGFNMNWEITSAFGSRGSVMNLFENPHPLLKSKQYDQLNWFGFESYGNYPRPGGIKYAMADRALSADESKSMPQNKRENEAQGYMEETAAAGQKGIPPASPAETKVAQPAQSPKIRSDFNETAFFYPQLNTNAEGDVVIKFKMPESLTRWKMMGLAYTRDLKIGQVEKSLVTQKDLMVFPNAPRFFREGDKMQFSAKVTNISNKALNGSAELHFFDALTMKPLDDLLMESPAQKVFNIDKSSSTVMNWSIAIPEGFQAIVYRITANAGAFSDGEEAPVPVLTNRMLVTESMPLPINGNQTKDFTFDKLYTSGKGNSTLSNYRLTLEFTSNPAWYAVQALPYLMEYPYECAEQLFSRYYSNSISSFIANSDPKIKRVFESWKNISPDALKSNLEKNQELKTVLIEESPWVREANNESERKQRIAILFDLNRMSNEQVSALKKLRDLQASNGGWPWFPGMPDSRYITQHIVTGLGHLDHLQVSSVRNDPQTWTMLQNAVQYLDARVAEEFKQVKEYDKDYLTNDHLGFETTQYLYARSYFMKDFPINESCMEAFTYFKNQSTTFWKTRNNYMKGMIALALNRFGDKKTPLLIMRSVSDKALHNEEMGMYWRNEQQGWFWYQAPVETQALLIEAYDEVLNDTKSVDELKVWLLKQKQTQDWKTTKATTEAVYALLLRGTNLLKGDNLAEVKVGNHIIDPNKLEGPDKPEAGTGYYKTSWDGSQVTPSMGKVTISNPNPSVAWGSMYWQYFEQLDKITIAETPLKLSKKLFREINSPTGPVIEPITESTPLHVGDKVVVRVELRTDRDMEYVHLKDMRAAAFEPINVLSGYHWQDGLGYYEATRDASSNFFINYLPKGTYVFEYRLFATQKGEFSNGITSVQCMYAPEFAAQSEGIRVKVE
jgi:hypothetical protein